MYCRNRTSFENFKLKICSCAQSHSLGTRTKFQLEIPIINVIIGIVYFREIISESSWNVSETTPWSTDEVCPLPQELFLVALLSRLLLLRAEALEQYAPSEASLRFKCVPLAPYTQWVTFPFIFWNSSVRTKLVVWSTFRGMFSWR